MPNLAVGELTIANCIVFPAANAEFLEKCVRIAATDGESWTSFLCVFYDQITKTAFSRKTRRVTLRVPEQGVAAWANENQFSIASSQQLADGTVDIDLQLSVEEGVRFKGEIAEYVRECGLRARSTSIGHVSVASHMVLPVSQQEAPSNRTTPQLAPGPHGAMPLTAEALAALNRMTGPPARSERTLPPLHLPPSPPCSLAGGSVQSGASPLQQQQQQLRAPQSPAASLTGLVDPATGVAAAVVVRRRNSPQPPVSPHGLPLPELHALQRDDLSEEFLSLSQRAERDLLAAEEAAVPAALNVGVLPPRQWADVAAVAERATGSPPDVERTVMHDDGEEGEGAAGGKEEEGGDPRSALATRTATVTADESLSQETVRATITKGASASTRGGAKVKNNKTAKKKTQSTDEEAAASSPVDAAVVPLSPPPAAVERPTVAAIRGNKAAEARPPLLAERTTRSASCCTDINIGALLFSNAPPALAPEATTAAAVSAMARRQGRRCEEQLATKTASPLREAPVAPTATRSGKKKKVGFAADAGRVAVRPQVPAAVTPAPVGSGDDIDGLVVTASKTHHASSSSQRQPPACNEGGDDGFDFDYIGAEAPMRGIKPLLLDNARAPQGNNQQPAKGRGRSTSRHSTNRRNTAGNSTEKSDAGPAEAVPPPSPIAAASSSLSLVAPPVPPPAAADANRPSAATKGVGPGAPSASTADDAKSQKPAAAPQNADGVAPRAALHYYSSSARATPPARASIVLLPTVPPTATAAVFASPSRVPVLGRDDEVLKPTEALPPGLGTPLFRRSCDPREIASAVVTPALMKRRASQLTGKKRPRTEGATLDALVDAAEDDFCANGGACGPHTATTGEVTVVDGTTTKTDVTALQEMLSCGLGDSDLDAFLKKACGFVKRRKEQLAKQEIVSLNASEMYRCFNQLIECTSRESKSRRLEFHRRYDSCLAEVTSKLQRLLKAYAEMHEGHQRQMVALYRSIDETAAELNSMRASFDADTTAWEKVEMGDVTSALGVLRSKLQLPTQQ